MLHHERGMSLVSLVFVPQLCSSLCPCSVGPLGQRKIGSGFAEVAMQGRAGQEASLLLWQGKDIYYLKHSVQCSGLCSVALGRQQAEQGGVDLYQGLYRRK